MAFFHGFTPPLLDASRLRFSMVFLFFGLASEDFVAAQPKRHDWQG